MNTTSALSVCLSAPTEESTDPIKMNYTENYLKMYARYLEAEQQNQALKKKVEERERRVKELRNDMTNLRKLYQNVEEKKRSLQKELKVCQETVEKISNQNVNLRRWIKKIRTGQGGAGG